ncbi:MAG: hypothetical protein QM286_05210 [Acidobacteriota bacterium]|nr:hypothetical protein [Acidobacteriota bacterium]
MNTTITAHDWVDAVPFRAWVRQLVSDTGLPWRVIARAAGVSSATVHALLVGRDGRLVRRLRQMDGRLLLQVSHQRLAALDGEPASCDSLRVLAWSLGLRGCRPAEIADFTGVDALSIRTLMAGGPIWCSRLQLIRAEAACEAWGVDPNRVLWANTASARLSA